MIWLKFLSKKSFRKKLQDEKENLENHIANEQKEIRAKVLQQILNNAASIFEELEGDSFLANITDDQQDWANVHSNFNLE